jgi:tRNA (guanine10-N2)-methyltransferase
MPARYLVVFAQAHHEFRIPELLSVAQLNSFTVTLPPEEDRDIGQPFTIIGLEREEHARLLCRRCILVK